MTLYDTVCAFWTCSNDALAPKLPLTQEWSSIEDYVGHTVADFFLTCVAIIITFIMVSKISEPFE